MAVGVRNEIARCAAGGWWGFSSRTGSQVMNDDKKKLHSELTQLGERIAKAKDRQSLKRAIGKLAARLEPPKAKPRKSGA